MWARRQQTRQTTTCGGKYIQKDGEDLSVHGAEEDSALKDFADINKSLDHFILTRVLEQSSPRNIRQRDRCLLFAKPLSKRYETPHDYAKRTAERSASETETNREILQYQFRASTVPIE